MAKSKKDICVVTSTRADYGLLFWMMKEIERSKTLRLNLVVTGTHLSKKFGSTVSFIKKDGFKIDKRINILSSKTGIQGLGETAGNVIKKFTDYFAAKNPAGVILLGDRFEILAVAQAAALIPIPVMHLHGGEITEGANDDMFRHAITKLSSFHFTSNSEHKKRVIQLGEHPSSVRISGALGIENINRLKLLTRQELEKNYKIKFKNKIFLVTFHPATMEKESSEKQFKNLLEALSLFTEATIVISKANADAGGNKINDLIDTYSKSNPGILASHSFGQLNYLSLMKAADVIIGNSSSGIIEAPSLGTPTVNIGTRQKGRLSAKSVLNCSTKASDIKKTIDKALRLVNKEHFENPYNYGNASHIIVRNLEKLNLEKLLPKKFYNLS